MSANTDSTGTLHGQLQVQAYGLVNQVDGVLLQTPTGGDYFPLFFGDATVTNGSVTVGTNGSFAGAVWSIKGPDGFEYVDNKDAGRNSQTAAWGIPAGMSTDPNSESAVRDIRRFNPTEGGAYDDINHQTLLAQPYTHSDLQSISIPASNRVTTTTQMALWTQGGQPVDANTALTGYPSPPQGTPGQTVSDFMMSKDVSVGFNGMSNVIRHVTTLDVPAVDPLTSTTTSPQMVFQVQQIIFTPTSLYAQYYYDLDTHQLVWFQHPVVEHALTSRQVPVQTDGTHYVAILSRQVSGSGPLLSQTYCTSVGSGGLNHIYALWQGGSGQGETFSGTYSFDNYIVVGTLSQVTQSLQTLDAAGWQQVNSADASKIVASGKLYATFTGYPETYRADLSTPTSWGTVKAQAAVQLAVDGSGNAYATFAGLTGTYRAAASNPTSWSQVNAQTASVLVVDGYGNAYATFVGVTGTYRAAASNPTSWSSIKSQTAVQLAVDGYGNVYGTFTGVTGTYRATASNPTSWTQTNAATAGKLAVDDKGYAFATFTGYTGTYRADAINYTSWSQVNAATASVLAVDSNGDIYVDFLESTTAGLWKYSVG